MKHHRSIVTYVSVFILALMFAPLAMAAGPASAASPPVAGSGLLALGSLFALGSLIPSGKAEDEETVSIEDAKKALADNTLPMMQRLKVAGLALKGVDQTGQLANVQGEYDRAMADLRTAKEENQKLTTELENLKQQLAAREKDVEAADTARIAAETKAKDLEAKETDLSKRAQALADEQMKERGVPAAKLPAATKEGAPEKTAEERIRALSGNLRTKAALHFQATKELPDWMEEAEKSLASN